MSTPLPHREVGWQPGDSWIVHVAGPPINSIQVCAACGVILRDNASWTTSQIVVRGIADVEPSWWPTGARVGVQADVRYLVQPDIRPLASDERLCNGAN